jgi:hypothetical protein
LLLLLLDRTDQCSCPPTQGSGESLAKLLFGWRWLCFGVIHLPGGIVQEVLWVGVVVFAFHYCIFGSDTFWPGAGASWWCCCCFSLLNICKNKTNLFGLYQYIFRWGVIPSPPPPGACVRWHSKIVHILFFCHFIIFIRASALVLSYSRWCHDIMPR